MKTERKKVPADYPQIAFRLPSEEVRDRINHSIEEIQKNLNAKRSKLEKKINKNDVILEAIEKGIKSMQRAFNK